MNTQVLTRQQQENNQANSKQPVQFEVRPQPCFLPEKPDLEDHSKEEDDDDDCQSGAGTGLLVYVVAVEPLDGDEVKGVVCQRPNPRAAEPEDRLFHVGGQAFEGAPDAHLVVHHPGDEHGREVEADFAGEEGGKVGVIRSVHCHPDCPEQAAELGEEEEAWVADEEGEDCRENDRDGEEGPAGVTGGAFDVGFEGEAEGEVGVEGDRGDAVALGAVVVGLESHQADDTTTACGVRDDARMDGRAADEGIASVDGRSVSISRRPADDQWLVDDFLIANRPGIQHLVTPTVAWAPERETPIIKRSAVDAVQATAVTCDPVGRAATNLDQSSPFCNLAHRLPVFERKSKGYDPDDIQDEHKRGSVEFVG